METIQMYVNNIFHSFPQTNELLATKEAISTKMIHRYEELKKQGYSENEAVGKTISELGNVDDLIKGLGVTPIEQTQKRSMSFEQVNTYLSIVKKSTTITAIGVVLCILGVALTCLFSGLSEAGIITILPDSDGDSMLSYISLFVIVGCAVSLFIYAGTLTSNYEFIKNGVTLDTPTKQYLIAMKEKYQKQYTTLIIIGVFLCILSPIIFFLMDIVSTIKDTSIPCVPFLGVIAIAVFLFIISSNFKSPYEKLLEESNKTTKQRKSQKLYHMINSIIMLLATAVYLVFGFLFRCWESAAIIYPVGGILCAISSTIIWGVTNED